TAVAWVPFPTASNSQQRMRGVLEMKTLAFGALFVGLLLVACGGGSDTKTIHLPDGPGSGSNTDTCNPLAQSGCDAGQMCTWIYDQAMPQRLGHVGCAPAGNKTAGQACTRNPAGAMGWDDCAPGLYCRGPVAGGAGTCKVICDNNGGSPMCPSGYACAAYQ